MSNDVQNISLKVVIKDADNEMLSELADELLAELQQTDDFHSELPEADAGGTAEGQKGDIFEFGKILLEAGPMAVPVLVNILTMWMRNREDDVTTIVLENGDRKVDITYNPSKQSTTEITEMVKAIFESTVETDESEDEAEASDDESEA